MEKIKEFNNFLSELILEQINHGELPFRLSERLIKLLYNINHKISLKLLKDNMEDTSSKFTLVDYDDDDIDMFTFTNSTKILDFIKLRKIDSGISIDDINFFDKLIDDKYNKIWKENRSKIKIGRFINKLYPNTYVNAGKPGEDIESFINEIKSERTKTLKNIKVVEDKDVIKYYYIGNYEKNGQGSNLWNSCMSGKESQPYIGFYPHNNVKLVILMSSQGDVIRGRALLWDIDEINGEKVNRKFMDRVYTIKQYDVQKFIDLAEKNQWLYKETQDMWNDTNIIDTKDGSSKIRSMVINNIKEYKAYPYMDTMKYFDISKGRLSNDSHLSYDVVLESSEGGYNSNDNKEWVYDVNTDKLRNINELIWSDAEYKYLDPDISIFSMYSDEWASKEYAEKNWVFSKREDDWIPKDDAVYIKTIKDYVSDNYAEENYMKCGFDKEWYEHDDGVPSNMWGIVPHDKIVVVIESEDINLDGYNESSLEDLDVEDEIDVRYKGDKTYFTIYCEKEDKNYHLDNKLKGSTFAKQLKKGFN